MGVRMKLRIEEECWSRGIDPFMVGAWAFCIALCAWALS